MLNLSFTAWSGLIDQLWWPLVRILGLMSVAPVLGHRALPVRIKLALGMLVALTVAPVLPAHPPVAIDSLPGFVLAAQEATIGLALGFAVRIVFAAVETAGELVGLQMGLSFAGYFDPGGSGGGNVISSWLSTTAALLFLSINGHLLLIAGVVESFYAMPIASPIASLQPMRIVMLGAELFRIALSLSLPFVALLLLVNLSMGVVSRVAPQINIFAVGFPVTMIVGLTALATILPYLEGPLVHAMERSIAVMLTR